MTPAPRDLACSEPWERSLQRSHARRVLGARRSEMPRACVRGASVAVAVALSAGPAGDLAGGLTGGLMAASEAQAAKKRARGPGVRALQRRLGLSADGMYGPQTKRAVKRYQRRHGLAADGVAGPQTRRSLGLGSGPVLKAKARARHRRGGQRPRRHSRRGGGVRALQRKLGLPADGAFGPQTERAVKRYQRRHGLTPDGVVGPSTRRSLGMSGGKMLKRRGSRGGSRTRGGSWSIIRRVVAAGNRIAYKPYRYGGGHSSYNDSGYDCSGSVSYALHGAGLLRTPMDSGGFMSYGRPGPGRHITIYANSGHMFMVVDGRRFDTSALRVSGSRWTSTSRSTAGYVARHPPGL